MEFTINRLKLSKILNLVSPLITPLDFKSITDSIYMEVSNEILNIKVVGEEVIVKASLPVEAPDLKFLTNAQKLIHLVTKSNTDNIVFTLTGSNIEEGIGNVKIKGNSTITLPLKNLHTFPDSIDFESIVYTKVDDDNFLDDVIICSNFTDKTAQNFKSGISVSKTNMVALSSNSGMFIIKKLPLKKDFTAKPNSFKILNNLSDLVIGISEEPKFAVFNGNMDDIMVYVAITIFNENYPYQEYISKAKKWKSEPHYSLEFNKNDFIGVLSRLDGIVSTMNPIVTIEINKNKATFSYNFQEYESKETISCACEDTFTIKMDIKRMKEMSNLCLETLSIFISKESPVVLMAEGARLYCGNIIKE